MGRGLHRLATAGVAAAVAVFCSLAIESQAAQLLTTITAPYPGLVTRSTALTGSLPGLTLLTLQDPRHGGEPWITDGTPAGTRLVRDIWPGPVWGTPSGIYYRLGNVSVFAASDGVHGGELWRTDGTAEGTYMLADIAPGPGSYGATAWPGTAAVLNGVLYFGANDTFTGTEVWRTDGTREGTYLFADLEPGYAGSHADHFIATSTHVYFSRQNPGERWVTDGTPAGTRKLADVEMGFSCMVAGDAVFCPGSDHRGNELWHASGDGSDLRMVANLHTGDVTGDGGSDPHPLVRLGDSVLFFAQTPVVPGTGGGGNDHKLFSVDLAGNAVTELLNVGHRFVNKFIALPRGAMFSVSEGPNVGDRPELWITDGTPAGTRPLDLDGLYYSNIYEEGDFKVAHGSEGEAYFHGRLPGTPGVPEPDKIWRTDGTREGTYVFADLNTISQEYEIAWLDGRVYFDAGAGRTHPAGNELWTSDGTAAGTHMVRDIAPNVPMAISSLITDLRAVNGRLMFYATRTGAALEPWSSDGTQNGTVRLTRPDTDINEPADAIVEFAGRLGSQVIFASNFGANVGRELGITDGTSSGTRVLHELKYAGASSDPADFLRLGDHLLFTASANNEPRRLWRTDGTPAGTMPLSPDNTGVQSFGAPDAILGGVAYWPGGNGLWRTDGTTAGTFQVYNTPRLTLTYMGSTGGRLLYQAQTISPDATYLWSWDGASGQVVTAAGSLKIASSRGVRFDNRVCFRAWNTNPQALDVWCSNGIADDAVRLTNLASAARSAVDIHTVGDRLLVNAAGADPGLYATQGTGGTQRIADVWIRKAAMLGTSRLVFTDDNRELWVTDGTSAGTRRLLQGLSLPGIPPGAFGVVGDHVVFVVNDSARGATLWRTDGTSAGTRYLLDLDPGTSGVSEDTFKYFAFDDRLMFSVFVPDVGNRMWSLDTADPNASDDAAAATGGTGQAVEVLVNDADFDGSLNPATVTIVTPPAHGTATVNATTGVITYTATTSYSGADSLTYRVSDDQGRQSNVATVSFQVTAGSSPPANPPPASGGGGGGGGALGVELWGLMLLGLWSARRRRSIQDAVR
jgi:ELWxxDGT repeat protein